MNDDDREIDDVRRHLFFIYMSVGSSSSSPSGDLVEALLKDEKLLRVFQRGSSNLFVDSRLACFSLALDAFRCADLQGARHPLCLARQSRHAQCVATRVAPEALDRLHACRREEEKNKKKIRTAIRQRDDIKNSNKEDEDVCGLHEADVLRVVASRVGAHAESIVFSDDERRAALHCGVPEQSRSGREYTSRLNCMASVVCASAWSTVEQCYASGKGGQISGACFDKAAELMTCMGRANARLMFKQV